MLRYVEHDFGKFELSAHLRVENNEQKIKKTRNRDYVKKMGGKWNSWKFQAHFKFGLKLAWTSMILFNKLKLML